MSAAPTTIQTSQSAGGDRANGQSDAGIHPPAPFGPSTWNTLYYVCMAATIVVGLGTVLNGGGWTDAILRMFVTLLGGSVLAIAFLTFVIIPLHVRHYENLVAAQKEAQVAAREKAEQEKVQANEGEEPASEDSPEPSFSSSVASSPTGPRPAPAHEDQASSLRRMAANPQ
ncbi:MAG: hypothetical protein KJZ86_11065 [Caldilineaceae bacterium]|nr:hypothetical protein [Caldilineaceae bacterium]